MKRNTESVHSVETGQTGKAPKLNSLPQYVRKNRGIKTLREWRALKRAECDNVLAAIDSLRTGCAFTPDKGEVNCADTAMKELRKKMQVKNWGR